MDLCLGLPPRSVSKYNIRATSSVLFRFDICVSGFLSTSSKFAIFFHRRVVDQLKLSNGGTGTGTWLGVVVVPPLLALSS